MLWTQKRVDTHQFVGPGRVEEGDLTGHIAQIDAGGHDHGPLGRGSPAWGPCRGHLYSATACATASSTSEVAHPYPTSDGESAVDRQVDTRDVEGLVGSQEQGGVDDVLWFTDPRYQALAGEQPAHGGVGGITSRNGRG